METISAPRSPGNSVPGPKSFKNPKRKGPRGPLSRKSPAIPPASPPLHVLPTSASPYLYLPFCNNNNIAYAQSQPPLLPLPRVNSSLPLPRANSSLPLPRANSVSRPPARFSGRASDMCQAQKKTVQVVDPVPRLTRTGSVPVGSYPGDLPKDYSYPGPALMLLSPPPSSLPMPRFSIKPKLSCKAEAAGKEDGAADNLRRLLRLR